MSKWPQEYTANAELNREPRGPHERGISGQWNEGQRNGHCVLSFIPLTQIPLTSTRMEVRDVDRSADLPTRQVSYSSASIRVICG